MSGIAASPAGEGCSRQIALGYLTLSDHPWLECLLAEYARFVGRRRIELEQHLKAPLAAPAPLGKLKLARRVLDREYGERTAAPVAPARVRHALFLAGARRPLRQAALEDAARELGLSPGVVEQFLFADLPGERRLVAPSSPLSAAEFALKVNHALICSWLKRATRVMIVAEGEVRALVRAVKLRGLLCSAHPCAGAEQVLLDISGPYALFRRTLVYGRALASVLPRVARCQRFELEATCVLSSAGEVGRLTLRSGDPIQVAAPLARYDSKVEEKFARDFLQLTDDWDLIREPEAVSAAGQWLFPDFLVRHRRLPGCQALLEIVGFWTPEYLREKLERLKRAELPNIILCVDEQRNCSDEELPAGAHVIRYRRRVPAQVVLMHLNARVAGKECPEIMGKIIGSSGASPQ